NMSSNGLFRESVDYRALQPMSPGSKRFCDLLREPGNAASDQEQQAFNTIADELEKFLKNRSEASEEIFDEAYQTITALITDSTPHYVVEMLELCRTVVASCIGSKPFEDDILQFLNSLNILTGEELVSALVDKTEVPAEVIESMRRLKPLVSELIAIKRRAEIGNTTFEQSDIPSKLEHLIAKISEEIEICGGFLSSEYFATQILANLRFLDTALKGIEERHRRLADTSAEIIQASDYLQKQIIQNAPKAIEEPCELVDEA
ncbi:hypothetical protein IH575_01915, partial [Candidatus Dojkabacteria bacterium]|nr:hypothetical protein [Candidatus Dojkabacteria bacterium]